MNFLDLLALTPADPKWGIGGRPVILAGMLACCERDTRAFVRATLAAVV